MTIDEAIEVLEGEVACWCLHPEEVYPKAFKLGVEALKRIESMRSDKYSLATKPLPGETKE